MWPFAAHLSQFGAFVTLVDLPGYGRTRPLGREQISYQDWRDVLVDLTGRIDDDRPLLLLGASMGGMLALDTAVMSGRSDRVIATCLLDVSDPDVRSVIVRAPWLARLSKPLLKFVRGPVRRIPLPLRWIAPMRRISNDSGLSAHVLRDRRGGGGSMPLGWFRTFLEARPAVLPELYGGPPVVLVHPDNDRWTPTPISTAYLGRLAGEHRSIELAGCGHFPIEEPGFQQFLDVVGMEIESVMDDARDAEQE
jgi:alpha-beta hydrolase superfamily lysophospholipase